MTVQELISALSEVPRDLDVCIRGQFSPSVVIVLEVRHVPDSKVVTLL